MDVQAAGVTGGITERSFLAEPLAHSEARFGSAPDFIHGDRRSKVAPSHPISTHCLFSLITLLRSCVSATNDLLID